MKRNPWPYAIISYFVLFVSAMAAWIVFAVRNDHELVRKDYYEQEIQFQTEIESAERTREIAFNVSYDSMRGVIAIKLPADATGGSIHLYRPASASLDKQFPLALRDGVQLINVRGFENGLWKIRLSWKANGQEYRHDEALVFGSKALL